MNGPDLKIDIVDAGVDPVTFQKKIVAVCTISAMTLIDQREYVSATNVRRQAIMNMAREKVLAQVLKAVLDAGDKIREKMPIEKGDTNGNNGNTNNG